MASPSELPVDPWGKVSPSGPLADLLAEGLQVWGSLSEDRRAGLAGDLQLQEGGQPVRLPWVDLLLEGRVEEAL